MNKKVRLAIGTAGVLPAAAAGVAVAPTAQATVVAGTSANYSTGTSINSGTSTTPSMSPAWYNCTYHGYPRTIGTYSDRYGPRFTGWDVYSATDHRCVHYQKAVLSRQLPGLTERTRFRSQYNALLRTTWQPGVAAGGKTTFQSWPNVHAYYICQALVANSNHNAVVYGPVCEYNGAQ